MATQQHVPRISLAELRLEIKKEYTRVALNPTKGYHFHTGRRLAGILGYDEALYAGLPESNILRLFWLVALLAGLLIAASATATYAIDPLIPNSSIVLGGSGTNRMLSVAAHPNKSGAATLAFNLSDGTMTIPVIITVRVGIDKDEILNGTPGVDMIFGRNGKNTLNGADFFSGAPVLMRLPASMRVKATPGMAPSLEHRCE